MICKVMFSHSDKSQIKRRKPREGTEVYRHPEGRFVVLEFKGVGGNFREAFWPEQIIKKEKEVVNYDY